MHGEERAKDGDQVLCGVGRLHGLGEPLQCNVEKFLHNLIADDSFLRRQCLADELRGSPGLRRCALIERINKDIGIEEESIAHSFLPC